MVKRLEYIYKTKVHNFPILHPCSSTKLTKSYVKSVGLRNPPGIHEVRKKQLIQ
jgi:hypothetical protein